MMLEAYGKQVCAFLLAGALSIAFPGHVSAATEEQIAYPTSYPVLLDQGQPIYFDAYALKDVNGNDTNYVKLRDLAYILNGTEIQFDVKWDSVNGTEIVTGQSYTRNGTEMSTPFIFQGNQSGRVCSIPIFIGDQRINLSAILLKDSSGNGYTYFKMRDLGDAIGFRVDWDGNVNISTKQDQNSANAATHEFTSYHIQRVDQSARSDTGKVLLELWYDLVVLPDTSAENQMINKTFQEEFQSVFSDEDKAEMVEFKLNVNEEDFRWFTTKSASITHNGNGILSIKDRYEMFMGGTESFGDFGVTFDLKTGKKLGITDLLPTYDPDTLLLTFKQMTKDYFLRSPGGDVVIADIEQVGILDRYRLEDFDFYVQDGEVILSFPQRSIAPGAYPDFTIPTGFFIVP